MAEQAVYGILATLIAIVLHELAHAVVAYWLGDDTAKQAGRFTLNPVKHLDKFGSVLLPLFLAVSQIATIGRVAFLYGWAKPVPVNAARLNIKGVHHPRQLMAVVAVAGPVMNFMLAILGGILIHFGFLVDFLAYFILVNLLLGLFNLIPLPPMDGGRIAVGLLPLPAARALAGMERYGILLVLLVLFVLPTGLAQLGVHFDPFHDAMNAILPWASDFVMRLTGHGVGS